MLEKTGLKSTGLVNMLEANKNSFLQFLFYQSKSYKLDQLAVQAGILWWYIVFFFFHAWTCIHIRMNVQVWACVWHGMFVKVKGQQLLEVSSCFFKAVSLLLLLLHILGKWAHQLSGHPPVSTSHLVTRSVGITDAQDHIMWIVGTEGFHCEFCYLLSHLPRILFGSKIASLVNPSANS